MTKSVIEISPKSPTSAKNSTTDEAVGREGKVTAEIPATDGYGADGATCAERWLQSAVLVRG